MDSSSPESGSLRLVIHSLYHASSSIPPANLAKFHSSKWWRGVWEQAKPHAALTTLPLKLFAIIHSPGIVADDLPNLRHQQLLHLFRHGWALYRKCFPLNSFDE